jgi:Putative restriction endonuclease
VALWQSRRSFCPRASPKRSGCAGDRCRADVDDKVAVYLRAGSSLVIVVDPQQRVVELHDRAETTRLGEAETIEHMALRGFSRPVRELFAIIRRP